MRYFKIPLQPTGFWAYMILRWSGDERSSIQESFVTLWKKLYFMQLLSGHAIYESDGSFFDFLLFFLDVFLIFYLLLGII